MKKMMIAAITVLATATVAQAQSVPNLKATWTGKWRTVIVGNNAHHPNAAAEAPRVSEIAFTIDIEGQDGRLLWGKSWSNPERKEPFVATVTWDGRTIVGADTDGSLSMRIGGRGGLDACYIHPSMSPSRSMVASCGTLRRAR